MSGNGTATADKARSIKQRANEFVQDSAGHLDECSPELGLQLLTFVHGGNSSGDSKFEGLLETALREACTGLNGQELADATQDFRMHVGRHLAKRFLATSCHGIYTQLAGSITGRNDHQLTLRDWLVAQAKPKTDAEAEAEALSSLDGGLQQLEDARVDLYAARVDFYLLQQEEHAARTRLLSRAANLPGDEASSGVGGTGPAPALTATTTTMTVPATHTLVGSVSNASQAPGGHGATPLGINPDVSVTNAEALIRAVYRGDRKAIVSLMKDPECGVLALCKSAENGDAFHVIIPLLNLGVDVNAKHAGESMLQTAARCNHSGVVNLLVFKGAKDVSGALVYAARYGDLELCKFLIEHKGSVHHDNGDATPLLAAVRNGHVNVAKLLFKHGAKPGRRESDGRSMLAQACQIGNASMCKLLVKQGANLDLGDQQGKTPLMYAAARGDIETAKILLKAGASLELTNEAKQTASAVATSKGHHAFAAWLQAFTKRRKI
jgi:hypothetical protein